jgi:hypothetical protein
MAAISLFSAPAWLGSLSYALDYWISVRSLRELE